ncbi:MAG: hypothetical protein AB7F66_13545 [Bacteriovoracia bacterium]
MNRFLGMVFLICAVLVLGAHAAEENEEGGSIGPDKGIVEASESKGFKLSPEALKNFDLKTQKLNGDGPWTISKSAIVHSGEETNLFRVRSGFFKRIDFQVVKKADASLTVDSDDLREGDEIVLAGTGFLRVSELAAFGGVAHGHSH